MQSGHREFGGRRSWIERRVSQDPQSDPATRSESADWEIPATRESVPSPVPVLRGIPRSSGASPHHRTPRDCGNRCTRSSGFLPDRERRDSPRHEARRLSDARESEYSYRPLSRLEIRFAVISHLPLQLLVTDNAIRWITDRSVAQKERFRSPGHLLLDCGNHQSPQRRIAFERTGFEPFKKRIWNVDGRSHASA